MATVATARSCGSGLIEQRDRVLGVQGQEPRVGPDETADVDRRSDRRPVFVLDGVEIDRADVDLFGDVREREPARFPRASELLSERRHVVEP